MAKNKMTKAEARVWAYLIDHPAANVSEVALACDVPHEIAENCVARIGTPPSARAGATKHVPPYSTPPYRAVLLTEAIAITTGDRERDYGTPVKSFARIAEIHNVAHGTHMRGSDVVKVMISVKRGRMETSPLKRDHYVDIMAYYGILYECMATEAEEDDELDALVDETMRAFDRADE